MASMTPFRTTVFFRPLLTSTIASRPTREPIHSLISWRFWTVKKHHSHRIFWYYTVFLGKKQTKSRKNPPGNHYILGVLSPDRKRQKSQKPLKARENCGIIPLHLLRGRLRVGHVTLDHVVVVRIHPSQPFSFCTSFSRSSMAAPKALKSFARAMLYSKIAWR